MKILNLVNKDKSDIKWELSEFPDGQKNIKILSNCVEQEEIPGTRVEYKTGGLEVQTRTVARNITIKARLNNFSDLEKIVCSTQSCKKKGAGDIHLYVPYFLGSRSDRSFSDDENNYLKHVICPIINLQGFKSVTVLDPHSDCLEMGLNGFKKKSNMNLVDWALTQIYNNNTVVPNWDKCILISPDAGASKKIYKVAEQIGYKGDIITCSKDRDTDGKLVKETTLEEIRKRLII